MLRLPFKPENRVDAFLCAKSAAHFKRHSSGRSPSSHCRPQGLERPPLTLEGLYSDLQFERRLLQRLFSNPLPPGS